jgi:very-short-patch-repair endonuclease
MSRNNHGSSFQKHNASPSNNGAMIDSNKLRLSIGQWRDSLINLTNRNKLLNYKSSKSAIEFSGITASEVFDRVTSKTATFIRGSKQEALKKTTDNPQEELEDRVINELKSFDYSAHKDSLVSDLTQREVDKILKTISSASRREFLDKGLSPLYLALGSLTWRDDDGDLRKSPLILVPVELRSSGPRQPLQIWRTDDDISANPALAIKMLEFSLTVPTSDEVIAAIDNDGMQGAIALFRDLQIPSGWAVEDSSTLSVFGFQREAMFRDLLNNEDLISDSRFIQALSGSLSMQDSDFFFDPIDQDRIDELAPPESTPLVLDADSSQRAAVAAALAGKSFVLDGPPGTGKSQTIANIIGALISEGKSVLFVSEKIVALEVVKSRLDNRGLGAFILELHSHKATRKEVAKHLGQALKLTPVATAGMSPQDLQKALELRVELNEYALAMNEVRQPLGMSVFRALGLLESLAVEKATPKPDFDLNTLSVSQFSKLRSAIERIGLHWDIQLAGVTSPWFGLERDDELAFLIESAIAALAAFEENYSPIHSAAVALNLDGSINGDHLYGVLEHWTQGLHFKDDDWLTSKDLETQKQAISRLKKLGVQIDTLEKDCLHYLGSNWKQVPLGIKPPSEKDFANLETLTTGWIDIAMSDVREYSEWLDLVGRTFQATHSSLDAFCASIGVAIPETLEDLQAFAVSLKLLNYGQLPPTYWLKGIRNLHNAKNAADILRPLTGAASSAQGNASLFDAGVLELDLENYSDYFDRNRSLARRLSSEYRDKKKTLRSFSKSPDWKETLASLRRADIWQRSVKSLQEGERFYATHLLPFYTSQETDWQLVEANLKLADQITSGLEVINPEAFENALDSKSLLKYILETQEDIRDLLSTWKAWAGYKNCTPVDKVEKRALASIGELLAAARTEFTALHAVEEKVIGFIKPSLPVSSVLLGIMHIENHAHSLAVVDRIGQDMQTGPKGSKHTSNQSAGEISQQLEQKLAWTERMRTLVNQERVSSKPNLPLTPKDCAALHQAKLPEGFKKASQTWGKAWASVESAFSSELSTELRSKVAEFKGARTYLEVLKSSVSEVDSWMDLKKSVDTLKKFGLSRALEEASNQDLDDEYAPRYLEKSILSSWVAMQIAGDSRLSDDPSFGRSRFVEEYRDLDRKIKDHSISQIIGRAATRRPRGSQGEAANISRESEKKTKHIPVRDLIGKSRNVIQGLQPCFMMSPLAVSQYLPSDLKFDVVIFDEASQVTPAEAINCAYRGRAVITAGDQKQLPPMSFFAASGLDEESLEEDVAGDYDSILDLMKASGAFNSLTLNWHYRSRHEHLIAYSNLAFYENRLITYPGAIQDSADLGVKLIQVKGVYRRSAGSDNPIEAQEIAKRVVHHFETRPHMSLGVVAFSSAQRDAIENAVTLARNSRPDLDRYFEGGRQGGFFVNSLESVQGDERDVIIFSIGYGPDEQGKIYKNFGPLNRAGGERRLNVAITRAKQLVEIVSSMSASEMGDVSNEGARHLRRYLDFAERGPEALQMELGDLGLGTDSPFEDSVIAAVRSWGHEVQPQVGVAGYRIDIGVKHPNNPGAFILGIECDGAMYHSSRTARDRDRLRHEILEGLGWKIHHIWGTAWYRHRGRELDKLKETLESQAALPIIGRLAKKGDAKKDSQVQVEFQEAPEPSIEDWTEEYVIAESTTIPAHIDLSVRGSEANLLEFVREVVSVEQPIHFDLLVARLRDSSSVGKVSQKIRETLQRAVVRAKVQRDGEFLWLGDSRSCSIRRPGQLESRDISLIADLELRGAVLKIVSDGIGASKKEISKSLGAVFGWSRIGPQIQLKSEEIVDSLVEEGALAKSGSGYKAT